MFCSIWYDQKPKNDFFYMLIQWVKFQLHLNSLHCEKNQTPSLLCQKIHTEPREQAQSQGCLLWHPTIWKEKGNKYSPGKLWNKHTVLFMLHIYIEKTFHIYIDIPHIYIYMRYTELGVKYLGQSISKTDQINKKQINPWHRSKYLISQQVLEFGWSFGFFFANEVKWK